MAHEPDIEGYISEIRKRDGDWRDDGSGRGRDIAARDRRVLLAYIDDLQQIVEEIAVDLGLIKKIHRARLQTAVTLPAPDLEQPPATDRQSSE